MSRPLEGRTIALAETRQIDELAQLLDSEGAVTLRCPMVSILDAPDADGPRLVFADWLQERGDSRGEFIRSQTERAAWVPDLKRRNALHRREAELLAAHGDAWMGELAAFCRSWRFERGFARVTMEARRFVTQRFRAEVHIRRTANPSDGP